MLLQSVHLQHGHPTCRSDFLLCPLRLPALCVLAHESHTKCCNLNRGCTPGGQRLWTACAWTSTVCSAGPHAASEGGMHGVHAARCAWCGSA